MRLLWPIEDLTRPITTRFGEILKDANGKPYTHVGIDISCVVGTRVLAPLDGYLVQSSTGLGGLCLTVEEGDWSVRYAHLSAYQAHTMERVARGRVVALSGNTGTLTTNPHLHVEVRHKGVLVDPLLYMSQEAQMPSSPSLYSCGQLQNPGAVSLTEINGVIDAGITRIKVLDQDGAPNNWPSWMKMILRLWFDDRDLGWIQEGAAGAQKWFEAAAPRFRKVPQADIVEGPNEPPHGSVDSLKRMNEFYVKLCELMQAEGRQVGILNFSEGNPEAWEWQYLLDCLRKPNAVLDLHEYRMQWQVWEPAANDGYHLGRYMKSLQAIWQYDPTIRPKLYIGEGGIDNNGNPYNSGWLGVDGMTPERYLERLIDAEAMYKANGYPIMGIFLFVWKPWSGQWTSFDLATVHSLLMNHVRTSQNPANDPILTYAEKMVIPMVPGFALWNYITSRSWVLASQEFSNQGWTYQWGYDVNRNVRVLCRAQAPSWAVQEYAVVPN